MMTQPSRILCFAVVAAAIVLLPSNAAAQLGSNVVTSFVVNSGTGAGTGNAIAVDSHNVHVAFYDRGNPAAGVMPTVKYESFPLVLLATPSQPATVDTLTPNPSFLPPQAISIAVDTQGSPHIVYQDYQGGVKYASIQGGVWTTEVIAASGGGSYNSIAVDKNGTPHVAYGSLTYATRSTSIAGVVWTPETVAFVRTLTSVSIVVDSQGQPQVAWGQHTPNDVVVYAARGTGLWHQEFVSSVDSPWVSLTIDANDTPSVSYWGWNGGSSALSAEVDYATRVQLASGPFWQASNIDLFNIPCCQPNPFADNMTSLSLSPAGDPRISYGSDVGVKLARRDAGAWSTHLIDTQAVDGFTFTSLAVDNTDSEHVLYRSISSSLCAVPGSCLVYQKVSAPNTPVGFNVNVTPVDSSTGTNPVTVNFGQVTQAGQTSLFTSSNGPAVPAGFQLGNPPVYYNLSTTAQFTGNVTICITSPAVTSTSKLYHFGSGGTVDVTSLLTPPTICGVTNSFSPYAILQPASSPATLNTTLTSSANTSVYGQAVTFTAGLAGTGTQAALVPAPTGTMTFFDGATALGSPIPLSGNGAALTITTLTVGTHTITAQYSGDSNYASSSSSGVTQIVNQSLTSLALSSSANPSLAGQTITFTSTLTGTASASPGVLAPSGAVTFSDGGAPLGPASLSTSGSAAFTTSTLASGTHMISAQYSGDANYAGSSSSAIPQTVNKSPTATSLDSSSSSPTFGQAITLTSAVSSVGTGSVPAGVPAPTGFVTFLDGNTPLALAVPLPGSGPATLTLSTLTAGTHTLTAQYSGDNFYGLSTSPVVTVTVNAVSTLTAIATTNVPYGTPSNVTVSVTPSSGSGTVTGSVTLSVDGGTALSKALSGGSATFSLGVLGAGSHSLSANYPAQGSFPPSAMSSTLTVTPAVVTITANNATKILNAVNPSLTWTATGFVNGDTVSVLTANPNCIAAAGTNSPVGSYSITCSGASAANYTFAYVPGTLKIQYATAIGHVIQPPINADGTSVLKQGRTVPAKFSVYDANGVSIGTPGIVSNFYLTGIQSGTTTSTVEDVVDTNNPDTAFRWDPTNQQWIFNITTANLSAGSTYIYTIALNDGSTIIFQYGLR